MNRNLTQRLIIYLAAVFFIISTLFTIGCAASKVKVEYEKENNSGYSEVNHKHKKGGPPPHAPAASRNKIDAYRCKNENHLKSVPVFHCRPQLLTEHSFQIGPAKWI